MKGCIKSLTIYVDHEQTLNNKRRFEIRAKWSELITLKIKVFQTGLQTTPERLAYGGGRKVLKSVSHSSHTSLPTPPTLPLSSASTAGSLGSKARIKTQNPIKNLKFAISIQRSDIVCWYESQGLWSDAVSRTRSGNGECEGMLGGGWEVQIPWVWR